MASLPFNMALMEFLASHRTPFLTSFFLAATFIGESGVYTLIILAIYVAWNKQLAIRLAVLVLATSSLNGILKLLIRNPRPFIREGTWRSKWAVSPKNAAALATEYSTPSGHAMAASAFYSYLYALIGNRYFRIFAVLAILLIGISRPYLGVHYFEDVLLGWAIGLLMALLFIRYGERLGILWGRLTYSRQIGAAVFASLALWLVSVAVNSWSFTGEPRNILADAGFLTGIVIARPLELRKVNFDPRSSNLAAKILRFLLCAGLMIAALLLLGKLFAAMAVNSSLLAYGLEYLRYAAAGFTCIFLAPLLFTRIGLAECINPSPHRCD
jgi:membrane-associated phospholipid phosphatase